MFSLITLRDQTQFEGSADSPTRVCAVLTLPAGGTDCDVVVTFSLETDANTGVT